MRVRERGRFNGSLIATINTERSSNKRNVSFSKFFQVFFVDSNQIQNQNYTIVFSVEKSQKYCEKKKYIFPIDHQSRYSIEKKI